MSNLIKASAVRYSEVIKPFDTNERANEFQRQFVDNYISENLALKQVSDASQEDSSLMTEEGEFTPGIVAEHVEAEAEAGFEKRLSEGTRQLAELQSEIEELRIEADRILEDARAEAEGILEDARTQVAAEAEDARNRGLEQGYEEGKRNGLAEAEKQISDIRLQIEDEREQLEKEYSEKIEELGPQFTELLIRYLKKLTGIVAEDRREIILHLINSAIKGRKAGDEYIIRVSSQDYPLVSYSKEFIRKALPQESSVEIIEDPVLGANQCMIETETKVFDCSLGEQLKGLINDLRLLAQID